MVTQTKLDFEEIIRKAKQGGYLSERAMLILWGMIKEAYLVGGLNYDEMKELETLLGNPEEKYLRDLDIAMVGEPEEDEAYAKTQT